MKGGTLKALVTRQMMQNPVPLYSDAAALDICLQVGAADRRPLLPLSYCVCLDELWIDGCTKRTQTGN